MTSACRWSPAPGVLGAANLANPYRFQVSDFFTAVPPGGEDVYVLNEVLQTRTMGVRSRATAAQQ